MIPTDLAEKYVYSTSKPLYLAIFHHKTHKNKNITFENMPYLLDIYQDTTPDRVVMKSTQSGITEYLIVLTFAETYYRTRNVFYVMPTEKLRNMVVNTRFNQSVLNTEFYRTLIKESKIDNMSIKQINNASVFYAISNAKPDFSSFSADTVIVDEEDECNQENLERAPERLAFCKTPETIRIGNPTYPDFGIDFHWKKSDMKKWYITCTCGNEFTPDFFKHVVREEENNDFVILDKNYEYDGFQDASMICDRCSKPVFRYSDGRYIAERKSRISGRQLSQLFTSRKRIDAIINQFSEAQTNPITMQRFYNGTLGLPYEGAGARLTDEDINTCMRDYVYQDRSSKPCIIGIDVGKTLHTVIFQLVDDGGKLKMKLIYANELHFAVSNKNIDIRELRQLMKHYKIKAGLIDAAPEDRLSRMISQNFPVIWRCRYLTENPVDSWDVDSRIYKTDRTMSMDGVKEALLLENLLFPKNMDIRPEFRNQLKAPLRVFEEKESTNGRWVWKEGNNPDHYYHAVNYVCIAKKLLLMRRK